MIQTLISVAPKLSPIVYKIIESDQNHWYGNQFIVDYGVIRSLHFEAFDYEDQFIIVERIDAERSRWWIKNFDADTKIWDGTSFLPDGGCRSLDALMKASLFHDVVYARMEEISKATGISVEQLQAFADDMLKILADGYGAKQSVTTPIHWIVRLGGSLYHRIKKYIPIFIVLSLCGCYTIQTEMGSPPPEVYWTGPVFSSLLTTPELQDDDFIVPIDGSDSTHVLDDSRGGLQTIL